MLRLYACIADLHDIRLVILAGILCVFSCFATVSLIERTRAAAPRWRGWWVAASAFAAGTGVWSTHFVAMLAFRPATVVSYDVTLTLTSVAAAVLLSGFGITLALRGGRPAALIGGVVAGSGAASMHYLGMAALIMPAIIRYDTHYIAVSILAALVFYALAFDIVRRGFSFRIQAMAAAALVTGILSLHFLGMTAMSIVPLGGFVERQGVIAPPILAAAIALVMAIVLMLVLLGSALDRHLMQRSATETSKLRASEKRFRQLAESTFEGIAILKDGTIIDVNAAFCELIGLAGDVLIARTVEEFIIPDHRNAFTLLRTAHSTDLLEVEIVESNGRQTPVEILARRLDTDDGNVLVIAMRDISERKMAEEKIHYLAQHDPLTRLSNRAALRERLDKAIEWARRRNAKTALLRVNIDRFRVVNDIHGSVTGDRVLCALADRLHDLPVVYDTVARIGSDEFAILVSSIVDTRTIVSLADRVLEAIAAPIDIAFETLKLSCSIGIAVAPMDGKTADMLMQSAESALQRARVDGRGVFRFFEHATDNQLRQRRLLELDLRHALEVEDEIQVYYQPLYHTSNGSIYAFEALCRWRHPVHGMISPADFIPIAEDTGLIVTLGEKVLRIACRQAATWPGDSLIAVNLSPNQFRHPALVETVLAILEEAGLPGERLELEITEGVLITEAEKALATMEALKRHGIRITLDDFGTGYSSLSYLHRFPFDVIKIDRSFVNALETDGEALTIISAIVSLGHNLKKAVTAEGVETEQQRRILCDIACDHLQGYLMAKPMAEPKLAPPNMYGDRGTETAASANDTATKGKSRTCEKASEAMDAKNLMLRNAALSVVQSSWPHGTFPSINSDDCDGIR